jgi:methylated-DNA-[protein]-cysteine S-methyltransferase
MIHAHTMPSPLGPITIDASGDAITALTIDAPGAQVSQKTADHTVLRLAAEQLSEYFAGKRHTFDLPLALEGTPFQRAVWGALSRIPYGQSQSYGDLGEAAGVGFAPRAVGGAVGANPVPIIVPCHRVLAANKKITGYSGGRGIPTKEQLLALEGISYR